jgi:hypothetical protein
VWRIFPSRVCCDWGVLVCGTVARNQCPSPGKVGNSHQTLTEAFVYAEDASQRKSRGLLGGLFHWTFRHLSIAVIPDSSAHAGSTEADTATVLIAAPLDVTLARRIASAYHFARNAIVGTPSTSIVKVEKEKLMKLNARTVQRFLFAREQVAAAHVVTSAMKACGSEDERPDH